MSVRVITGDCREVLKTLPSESVDCIVTSPPYYGLRDYGVAGQLGLEETPDAYVKELVGVFADCRRVLKDTGVMFLNLGDSYWTSGARQTGRGDTDRETPGGRGGSFRGGVRRAIACGKDDKAPEGFPASDCFCQSLCDACREAYRIGKSHSGSRHASMPLASNSASSRARKGSPSDHLPKSGLIPPVGRNLDANRDPWPLLDPEDAPLRASLASTTIESAPPPLASNLPASSLDGECRLCGRSLRDCVPASVHRPACTCDTAGDGSVDHTIGKDASGSAYQSYTTASLKPKDLLGIPWLVAFALRADGWWLRQDIIWSKPNPMPESVTDRCTKAHEYLFLLSKSSRYFYDAGAIAELSCKGDAGSRFDAGKTAEHLQGRMARGPRPQTQRALELAERHGLTEAHLAAIRAVGVTDVGKAQVTQSGFGKNTPEVIALAGHAKSVLGGYYREFLIAESRNKRSVWEVATAPFSEAHFATFPPDLIEPCIKAGCPEGGTVLDPFGGAGTTGLVADRLQRSAILIELNPTYAAMAERRIHGDAPLFAEMSAA